MTDAPKILLADHLKTLKLPIFLREYNKLARQCATEGLDHVQFLARLVLPGLYDGREGLIHGPDTVEALARFRANLAVLGASGVTAEGPHDAAIGPAMVYGAMMRRATRSIIVADHSKFDRPSLALYGTWSARVTLVSDRAPEGELAAALAAVGAEIHVAAP